MKTKITALLCVLAIICCSFSGCAGEKETDPEAPALVEPAGFYMDTAVVERGDVVNTLIYSGEIVPVCRELSFEIDGKVEEMFAYSGQYVEAGTEILRLDQTSLQEKKTEKEEKIESIQEEDAYQNQIAELNIRLLQIEYEETVLSDGADSTKAKLKAFDIEEAQLDKQEKSKKRQEEIAELQKEIQKIEEELLKGVLVAPSSGNLLLNTDLTEGTYVSAETVIGYLQNTEKLVFRTDSAVRNRALTDYEYYLIVDGKQYDVEELVIPENEEDHTQLSDETKLTYLTILNPDSSIKAGAFGLLTVETYRSENTLYIPVDALLHEEGGAFVYVMEGDTKVRREVSTKRTTDRVAEISGGLKEGETVFVQEISDTMKMNTVQAEKGTVTVTGSQKASKAFLNVTSLLYEGSNVIFKDYAAGKYDYLNEGDPYIEVTTDFDEIELIEAELKLKRLQEEYEEERATYGEAITALQETVSACTGNDLLKNQILLQKKLLEQESYEKNTQETIRAQQEEIDRYIAIRDYTVIPASHKGVLITLAYFNTDQVIKDGTYLGSVRDGSVFYIRLDNFTYEYGEKVTVYVGYKNEKCYSGTVVASTKALSNQETNFCLIKINEAVTAAEVENWNAITVEGTVSEIRDVLTVPSNAVNEEEDRYFVYLVDSEGNIHKRYVQVGLDNKEVSWITAGLEEGDTIVLN